MPICIIHTIWIGYAKFKRKEVKQVKLAEERSSVLVQIKTKQRDTRETVKVDNPGKPDHGKEIKNKRFDKMYYETVETIELFETNPKEVKEAVMRGVLGAIKK